MTGMDTVKLWSVRLLKSRQTIWCQTKSQAQHLSSETEEGTFILGPYIVERNKAGLVAFLNTEVEKNERGKSDGDRRRRRVADVSKSAAQR